MIRRPEATRRELAAAQEQIAEQERQIERLRAQLSARQPVVQPPDDLTEIHGIGPKIARVLNEMGITTFRQIAEFSDADIQRVATGLSAFPDRIARDHWIDEAKRRHAAKYGEGGYVSVSGRINDATESLFSGERD